MDVLDRDFFTDPELFQDPTPWYAAVREQGPVWREPCRGAQSNPGRPWSRAGGAGLRRASCCCSATGRDAQPRGLR